MEKLSHNLPRSNIENITYGLWKTNIYISKAYDMVSWDFLMEVHMKEGFRGRILFLIKE